VASATGAAGGLLLSPVVFAGAIPMRVTGGSTLGAADRISDAGRRGDARRRGQVTDEVAGARNRVTARRVDIGLDNDTYHAQLADLRRWVDTVLRQQYSGYEFPYCWPATLTPSGNYPPWPPNGTTATGPHVPATAKTCAGRDEARSGPSGPFGRLH
jgi:hypothetical protein